VTKRRTLLVGVTLIAFGGSSEPALAAHDLSISNGATSGVSVSPGSFSANADDANLNVTDLTTALAVGDVTVDTGSGGSQNGDIHTVNPITSSSTKILSLSAAGAVDLSTTIQLAGSLAITSSNPSVSGQLSFTGSAAKSISSSSAIVVSHEIHAIGSGALTVAPLITLSGGLLTVDTGASVALNGGLGVGASSTVDVDGSLSAPSFVVPASATVMGSGTLTGSVVSAGTVKPGSSPGVLSIIGDYNQSPSGTLEVEANGLSAGTGGYDRLDVYGQATLNGTLKVTTGFAALPGAVLSGVVRANSLFGAFATLNNATFGFNWVASYLANAVNLTNTPIAGGGDPPSGGGATAGGGGSVPPTLAKRKCRHGNKNRAAIAKKCRKK